MEDTDKSLPYSHPSEHPGVVSTLSSLQGDVSMSLLFPSAQALPAGWCCAELFWSVFPLGHQAGQAWVQTIPEQPGEPLLCPEPAQPPSEPLWSCGDSGKGIAPLAFGTDPWLLWGAGEKCQGGVSKEV